MDSIEQLDRIFNPNTIAVIGASATPGKVGCMCMETLLQSGFKGRIYPVHHTATEIFGLEAYPSVTAVPERVDVAIVMVRAQETISILEECVAKGVTGVILISSGFKEVGTAVGAELQARLRDIAGKSSMGIIGPNTLGIMNFEISLNATFQATLTRGKKGSVAVASQSGGMCAYILDALTAQNVGISKMISLGNRCNIDFDEMVSYFAQDELTNVILLYMEGLEHPRRFKEAARQAVRRKPVVVYKAGRGNEMNRATSSHTGALAGTYEFYEAAFAQAGVITADSTTDLADMAKALSCQPPASGNRIAVVSVQAGPGIIMADGCRALGLKLAQFSPATKQRLRQLVSPLNSVENPVDPAWELFSFELSQGIIETVLRDEGVDAVIVAAVEYTPELTRAVVDVRKRYAKPMVTCLTSLGGPGRLSLDQQNMLEGNSIPTYPLPERAVTGLAGLVRYGNILRALGATE